MYMYTSTIKRRNPSDCVHRAYHYLVTGNPSPFLWPKGDRFKDKIRNNNYSKMYYLECKVFGSEQAFILL